ncbi:hypothetical protein LB570_31205, partial [Mesorhizobium sp. BR1-1-5]|nr:hypothetical protein [Mesorhizobium sp. BR1-1-5]
MLDAVDGQQQADSGRHDTDCVHAPRPSGSDLAQQNGCEAEEQGDDWQVDQEHRSPPEALQTHATDDRAERESGGERRGEDAD